MTHCCHRYGPSLTPLSRYAWVIHTETRHYGSVGDSLSVIYLRTRYYPHHHHHHINSLWYKHVLTLAERCALTHSLTHSLARTLHNNNKTTSAISSLAPETAGAVLLLLQSWVYYFIQPFHLLLLLLPTPFWSLFYRERTSPIITSRRPQRRQEEEEEEEEEKQPSTHDTPTSCESNKPRAERIIIIGCIYSMIGRKYKSIAVV